jgi:hypothetical protein
LRTALPQSEGIQHLGGAAERNPRRLLTDGQRRKKDGDEPILSPRQTIARVPRDLQNELSIAPFVE